MSLELGGRGEFTSLDLDSTVSEALAEAADELATIGINIVDGNQVEVTEDFFEFNPSAHFRWDVTDRTQMRLSAARTIRRPNFDQLNPTLLIDDEESILGNPGLDQETAIGFDAGIRLRARRQPGDPRLQRLLPDHQRQDRAGRRAGRRQRDFPGIRRRGYRGDGLGEQPERRQDLGRRARLQLAGHLHRPEPARVRELHLDRFGDPRRQRELPDRPPLLAAARVHLQRGIRPPAREHRLHLGRELPEAGTRPRSGSTSAPRRRKSPTSNTRAISSSSSRRRSRTVTCVRLAAQNLLDADKDEHDRDLTSRSTS